MLKSPAIVLAASVLAVPVQAQSTVDTAGSGALIAEALERSEVMENLRYLSDVIGPRLSGSPAMRRANEWTAERFRSYGHAAHQQRRAEQCDESTCHGSYSQ